MKLLYVFLFSFIGLNLFGQADNFNLRSMLDERLEPFYHGVASGDPLKDKVIIWTRVTPRVEGIVSGTWKMGKDTLFNEIVKSGNFSTDSSKDYTVKIDVDGLEPDTWYFYEFTAYGKNSLTGRTKTAPSGDKNQLRFATVSCSNYPVGFFNAYDRIRERNDIDAVFHLGDYIYEYANSILALRQVEPESEIIKLADYRIRHSIYKLDPDLRSIHQQYPFITVWDDHETANNSFQDGAENHDASEGTWQDRKSAGVKAYDEWLPIRLPEDGNELKIFRKIPYGDLADIFMLDTRLYERDEQGSSNIEYRDTSRHLLGFEQMNWLKSELLNSSAKWKIIGQQVMFGQLTPFGLTLNSDQWDGYLADRNEILDFIKDNNIDNVIVLTGDIHTAWAMDVAKNTNNYNPNTGEGSLLVEFVCTSVTSTSLPFPLPQAHDLIESILPHIKYVDVSKKGYSILDITDEKAQNDFFTVTVNNINNNQNYEESWFTNEGENHLRKAEEQSNQEIANVYLAPELPRIDAITGINSNVQSNFKLLGVYPNPFIADFGIQFNLLKESDINYQIFDMTGKEILNVNLGKLSKGLHFQKIDGLLGVSGGNYLLSINIGTENIKKSIVKVNP
ncbi:MAG: alkaline phosphatase D family protein [Bacteroidetes bacterium]|nr:alkaline phosphatase D family protein [Bacteroidota bacterium]